MPSSLGELATSTRTAGSSSIALRVALPVGNGQPVVLQALRPRPIHGEAVRVSRWLMLLTGVIGLIVLAVVLAVSRLEVRRQLRPLRRTTDLMTRTGDRSVRVAPGRGEIGALGRDINTMLDAITEQDRQLEEASQAREEQALQAREQQRHSAVVVRRRAQSAVDDTVQTVLRELEQVAARADAVAAAASDIDDRVSATTAVTSSAHGFAAEGEQTSALVAGSLEHVGGITEAIGAVARQTHLLALNATIEAARAGEAGRGFSVVAEEVKQLAGHTAESAQQISQTLGRLDTDISAMTDVITRMASSVVGIDRETGQLLTVAADQRSNLDGLRDQLDIARRTIQNLIQVTDTIERRSHERIPLTGRVVITFVSAPDRPQQGTLLDLSEGGLRCRVAAGSLPAGDDVTVGIDSNLGRAQVRARVVRRTDEADGTELGLSFADPAEPQLRDLLDLLDLLEVSG
jgi:methyl-accepting chemotaxis protein